MPKKRFAQHFLTDVRTLRRIVRFAQVGPEDVVVEIGAGTGTLTRVLAESVRQVIAIEIDRELVARLRPRIPANVALIEADALYLDLRQLGPQSFSIVSNLPYNVSTRLLERFIESRTQIRNVTVAVQREIAQRIMGAPGTADYSPLSIWIQYYAVPTYGFTLPPRAFRPMPKVHTSVIRLDWCAGVDDAPGFFRFVQGIFGRRRKKVINNVNAMYPERNRAALRELLERLDIPADARPEDLSIPVLLRLYGAFTGPQSSATDY